MAEEKMTQAVVLEMVRSKQITPSRGAELLKVPLQDFLELMSKNRIPVLDYELGTLDRDLGTLRKNFTKAKVSE